VLPQGEFIALAPVTQKNGKGVHAFAVEADLDLEQFASNTFEIEWPPRSGQMREFPEIDRAEFFSEDIARGKINPAQIPLLDRLRDVLDCLSPPMNTD
jgi:predicted NUDIX family NTP pyrophosphohydrolase